MIKQQTILTDRMLRSFVKRGGYISLYPPAYCKGALRLVGIIGRGTIGKLV